MHADEVHTDVSLVRRLLDGQFPQWAGLPIAAVRSAGTDNAIYRLGDDMVVRLPRIHWAVGQADREHEWLPRLAPLLPLDIPTPLARGAPAEGYPWSWAVHRWLDGDTATPERIADEYEVATELAQFVDALQRVDTTGAPPSHRGLPLVQQDVAARAALAELHETIDTDAALAAWESALATPDWDGPPTWLHGDLQAGNLLAREGRLSAVIDFGCFGVGDPACDFMVAWTYFSADTRDVFRAALPIDDATWARGRGWALSIGLIALPYYTVTNPVLAGIARHAIDEVLADHASG
jgi:aminoglycoside phosphotransferase (APT) family kinase protein